MSERFDKFFHPPLADLVSQIDAANHGWKLAQDLFGADSPLALNLKEQKAALQIRLLRTHASAVRLILDPEVEGRPTFGIHLLAAVGHRENAAHIPVDEVRARLSPLEFDALDVTLTTPTELQLIIPQADPQ